MVLLADDTLVYVKNLEYWSDQFHHKTVIVKGILEEEKIATDPVKIGNEVTAGMYGKSLILYDAEWKAIPPAKTE